MPKKENEEILKTTCFLCHGGCTLLAHVKNGKLTRIHGAPEGPLNKGSICEKGNAAVQYIYSPDRLKYPLKRAGPRGAGKWQRITWDEAFDTVVKQLTKIRDTFGGESIAYAWGTARVVLSYPRLNFFNGVLGTPNGIGVGHFCLTKTRMPVMHVTVGPIPGLARTGILRDFDRADCIVAWGDSLFDSRNDGMGGLGRRLMSRLEGGCKLIVIDPVFTRAAAKADIWLPIRPGTDLALAMAWINIIIKEKLYDREFVQNWTNAPFLLRNDTNQLLRRGDIEPDGDPYGFMVWDRRRCQPMAWDSFQLCYVMDNVVPAFRGNYSVDLIDGSQTTCRPVWQALIDATDPWDAEKAGKVCWLTPEDIRASARIYATTKPACIEWGVSMSQCSRSTATNQAILQVKAITGNLDIAGGNAFWHVPGFRASHTPLDPGQEEKRITGGYAFSTAQMSPMPSAYQPDVWKAAATGEPYRVRALYGETSNPLVSHEKPDRYVLEALKKLDFIVWSDITMTPSNQWADIILPVSTPFERNWVHSDFDKGVFAGQAVIEPLGESRSDFDIYRELCHRMGRPDLWPWKTERDYCDWKLKNTGFSFEELLADCFLPAPEEWRKHEKGLLREDGKPGYPTASGKLELYASQMERACLPALPKFSYPPESYEATPELSKLYPYILIIGSRELNFPYFHSQYHQVPWLRELQPWPLVLIHPVTAKSHVLNGADWAWV